MTTQYTCPSCGLPVEVDTDSPTFTPDADGESARVCCPTCGKEITVGRPASAGFGGSDAT